MVNEIIVDKKERTFSNRIGCLGLSVWKFSKKRLYRNIEGEVCMEFPFSETLFLISKGKSTVWLKPDEIRDLKCVLEMHEKVITT